MYFQACSNSAYPVHSGERYRTSGPMVIYISGFIKLYFTYCCKNEIMTNLPLTVVKMISALKMLSKHLASSHIVTYLKEKRKYHFVASHQYGLVRCWRCPSTMFFRLAPVLKTVTFQFLIISLGESLIYILVASLILIALFYETYG